jgi:hypothetical protein
VEPKALAVAAARGDTRARAVGELKLMLKFFGEAAPFLGDAASRLRGELGW